jgi:hypothetical protein
VLQHRQIECPNELVVEVNKNEFFKRFLSKGFLDLDKSDDTWAFANFSEQKNKVTSLLSNPTLFPPKLLRQKKQQQNFEELNLISFAFSSF